MRNLLLALFLLAVVRVAAGAVRCDSSHECPSGNTCCHLPSGQWGCCPLSQAVCCQDGVHCCPNGYKCDPSAGKCEKGPHTLAWLQKTSATVTADDSSLYWEKAEAVKCDATHECPTGNTCCKTSSGQWGCCPLSQAVCCQDHLHCCPHGYKCAPSAGRCEKGSRSLPWMRRTPAVLREKAEAVKCDATHECPTGNTCCKTSSGQWGCCPLSQAVCCQDHLHCCPHGYKCAPSAGRCEKGSLSLPWMRKTPAVLKP